MPLPEIKWGYAPGMEPPDLAALRRADTLPPPALDELEPAKSLPGTCEQEGLLVMMPSTRSIGYRPVWCTVDVVDHEIAHVHFEPGWRETVEELGYPWGELWVEQLIEALARVAFLRRHPR